MSEALGPCYDAHCHALTLSHPCFLSFIEAIRRRRLEAIYSQMISPNYLATALFSKAGERIRNLLSVMENDVASIFELMEDDLAGAYAKPGDPPPLLGNRELALGPLRFDRLVLIPLIVDFDEPEAPPSEAYYDRAPAKPVAAQVSDVLQGIREYRRRRPEGFLEIRPFLGINPANYDLEALAALLARSFADYRRDREASRAVFLGMRNFAEGGAGRGSDFAGIKVYPPLGFDPWPAEGAEREKVELLYRFAEERGIPLTTHCDDQGFRVVPLEWAWTITAPARWLPALERFPRLRLDFAHFGAQYSRPLGRPAPTEWTDTILNLMAEYPGVYADLSFSGAEPGFYENLWGLLGRRPEAERERALGRILFGSDFLVNLTKVRSYADYYRSFAAAPLPAEVLGRFCRENPERFLYGALEGESGQA